MAASKKTTSTKKTTTKTGTKNTGFTLFIKETCAELKKEHGEDYKPRNEAVAQWNKLGESGKAEWTEKANKANNGGNHHGATAAARGEDAE